MGLFAETTKTKWGLNNSNLKKDQTSNALIEPFLKYRKKITHTHTLVMKQLPTQETATFFFWIVNVIENCQLWQWRCSWGQALTAPHHLSAMNALAVFNWHPHHKGCCAIAAPHNPKTIKHVDSSPISFQIFSLYVSSCSQPVHARWLEDVSMRVTKPPASPSIIMKLFHVRYISSFPDSSFYKKIFAVPITAMLPRFWWGYRKSSTWDIKPADYTWESNGNKIGNVLKYTAVTWLCLQGNYIKTMPEAH